MTIDTRLIKYVLPEIVTKADLEQAIDQLQHRLTVRFFGMMLGVVGVMNGILFALLRVVRGQRVIIVAG